MTVMEIYDSLADIRAEQPGNALPGQHTCNPIVYATFVTLSFYLTLSSQKDTETGYGYDLDARTCSRITQ